MLLKCDRELSFKKYKNKREWCRPWVEILSQSIESVSFVMAVEEGGAASSLGLIFSWRREEATDGGKEVVWVRLVSLALLLLTVCIAAIAPIAIIDLYLCTRVGLLRGGVNAKGKNGRFVFFLFFSYFYGFYYFFVCF